jgi:hypothetical protein
MKRFAERSKGWQPQSGYLAECKRCGLVVVHAESTGEPLHMHRRSKLCRTLQWDRADRAARKRCCV